MQEKYKKLSVLIPVYNEKQTINECVKNVLNAKIFNMSLEVVISDNNSIDGTKEILKTITDPRVKILFQEKNKGKGSNIKNALSHASGDIILFQDGDLEYSPDDYENLLGPFFKNDADVVYGSRLTRAKTTRITGFPNFIGNKIITFTANCLYNKIFSDIATGYITSQGKGNVQLNTEWTVKGLAYDDYTWGVQAIDNSFSGSTFTSATFNHLEGGPLNAGIKPVLVYPNPVQGELKLHGTEQVKEVVIFSLAGDKVYAKALVNESSLTLNLAKGVYVLNAVYENGERSSEKIIIL